MRLLVLGIVCTALVQAQAPVLDGIAHVAFRVAGLEASRSFYQKLGFEQAFESGKGGKVSQAFLKINDRQYIELYPQTGAKQPVGLMHVCYEAADLAALNGDYVKREVNPSPVRKAGAGNLLFTMKDPEGETLEYTQYMPGSRHMEAVGKYLGAQRIAQRMVSVTVPVRDLRGERVYYTGKLGFQAVGDGTDRLQIPGSSGQEIELAAGGVSGLRFAVTDVPRAAEELRSRGLSVNASPAGVWVADPDGNAILFAVADARAAAPGRSDASFSQPSLAAGVDYTVPSGSAIKATLDRIRDYFVRSTPYRIVDSATGAAITDFTTPLRTAGIDMGPGQFNDWDYPMGVVLAAMLDVSEVTGDATYRDYALKNFDFIFDHSDYFRRQAKQFGPQTRGLRRLLEMRELDDCGAIGAALVRAYAKKPDPRYRATIGVVADFISHKMSRMPDGTLARRRPQQPFSLWVDDFYMSIPFLAQMGALTKDPQYFDDGARQVIQMSERLLDKNTGLYDHAWYANTKNDPRFYWGRGAGWALMATSELLSVLPEAHPDRAKVLAIFRRSVQAVAALQSGTGMWHQLLDRTDSYLESSATAMFTFAIARGVNRGWIEPTYAPVAQAGWQALATRVRPDGRIEGICVSTTAAYDAVYYYNRPTELGAMQGYGPVLMAGAEVMTLLRSFDIDHTLNTFHYRAKTR
jgi:unsaturated rhamnogalacturonyl hydrolase